eukprot:TRINITY_DN5598_c0_g1_i2.p1 TRINITY_DN5598_c0_g1~~TRINITY_DN5598_c0_g1_i2.p1  ORF type:complete len:123 (+),score=8.56 TRINITY_DN5598_c0_g1_i2:359-727(+)
MQALLPKANLAQHRKPQTKAHHCINLLGSSVFADDVFVFCFIRQLLQVLSCTIISRLVFSPSYWYPSQREIFQDSAVTHPTSPFLCPFEYLAFCARLISLCLSPRNLLHTSLFLFSILSSIR